LPSVEVVAGVTVALNIAAIFNPNCPFNSIQSAPMDACRENAEDPVAELRPGAQRMR
jgi:hypothetical protein